MSYQTQSRGRVVSEQQKQTLNFWQVVASVVASFLGVQSNHNRERDFQHGKPAHYIIIGLAFVILFVLAIIGVVQLVMHFAGQ